MKILYCRVGWMNSYNGLVNDSIKNGGSYNKDNTGHEIYNFSVYDGVYYGYVQAVNNTINIDNITKEKEKDYIDNVLVVWVATRDNYGQVIVGWYRDARVYRNCQNILDINILKKREDGFYDYNIYSENATLILPVEDRIMRVKGMGQSNVWYGNDITDKEVLGYIEDFDNRREFLIDNINSNLDNLEGEEKEVITKARINQGVFRNIMLKKYRHCCLCGIDNENLLIASHIKPWSKCDKNEKVNEYNGLLLCAMHDKLFDLGYISFNDDGTILISNSLSKTSRIFSNIDEDKKIIITDDNIPFIKYHRENIYKK